MKQLINSKSKYQIPNKFSNPKFQKGFSLLEILVVISIIGILLAVAVSSYSNAQKKSRDARRRTDLKAIQQAAEQYYSVCGYKYPTGLGTQPIFCASPSTLIMPTEKIPFDPLNISPYPCLTSTTCNSTGFTICNTTEVEPTNCVTNQQ